MAESQRKRIQRHFTKLTFHSPEERKQAIEKLVAMPEEEVNQKLGQLHSDFITANNCYAKVLTDQDQKDLEFILSNYDSLDEACYRNPYKIYYCIPEEGKMEFDSSVKNPEIQNVINAMHIINLQRKFNEAVARNAGKTMPTPDMKSELERIHSDPYRFLLGQDRYVAESKDKAAEYFRQRGEAPVEEAEAFELFRRYYNGDDPRESRPQQQQQQYQEPVQQEQPQYYQQPTVVTQQQYNQNPAQMQQFYQQPMVQQQPQQQYYQQQVAVQQQPQYYQQQPMVQPQQQFFQQAPVQAQPRVLTDEEVMAKVNAINPIQGVDGSVTFIPPKYKDLAEAAEINSPGCMADYQRPVIKADKSLFVKEARPKVNFKNVWNPLTGQLTPYIDGKPVVSDNSPDREFVIPCHPNPYYRDYFSVNEPDYAVIEPSQQWYFINGAPLIPGVIPFQRPKNFYTGSNGAGVGNGIPVSNKKVSSFAELKDLIPGIKPMPLKEYLARRHVSPEEIKSLFKKGEDGSETIKISDIDKLACSPPNTVLNDDDPFYANRVNGTGSHVRVTNSGNPSKASIAPDWGRSNYISPIKRRNMAYLMSQVDPFDVKTEKLIRKNVWNIPENIEDLHVGLDAIFNMDMSIFRPTQEELDEGLAAFVTLEINGKKLDEEGWERDKKKMIKKKKGPNVLYKSEPAKMLINPDPETIRKIDEGKLWSERIYEIDDDGNIVRDITDVEEDDEEESKEEVKLDDFKEAALKVEKEKRNELAFKLAKELRRYNNDLAEDILWAKDNKSDREFGELKEEAIKQLIQYRNADPMASAKSLVSAGVKFMTSPPLAEFSLNSLKIMADKSIEYSKRETEEKVIEQYQKQADIVYDEIAKGGDEAKSEKDTVKGILKKLAYLNVQLVNDSNWTKDFEKKMIKTPDEAAVRNNYLLYKRLLHVGFEGTQDEYDREFDEWWNGRKPKTLEEKLRILNKKRRQLASLQSTFLSVALMTPERQAQEDARLMEIVNRTLDEFTQGCLRPDMSIKEFNEGMTYLYGRALDYKIKRQNQELKRLYDPLEYSRLVRETAMADAMARGEPFDLAYIDSKEYSDKRQRFIDTIFSDMKEIKTITSTRKGETVNVNSNP